MFSILMRHLNPEPSSDVVLTTPGSDITLLQLAKMQTVYGTSI